MEIKKADSKGRVSGFEPGELYALDREKGYFSRVPRNDLLPAEAETVYLLSTKANAEHLMRSIKDLEVVIGGV